MSFDDLLALLLFLLFIVLPALNRASRSRRRTPPPGAGRAAGPAAGGARPPQGPMAGADQGASFERRLAEARERVQQAMGGGAAASAQPSQARPSAPAPATTRPSPVRSGRLVVGDRDDGLLSTPLAPASVATLGRERPASVSVPDAPQARTAQLRQTAPPVARRATAAAAAGFATDPETLREALVWHQIFGEPRARRPLGGRPSTLRSR